MIYEFKCLLINKKCQCMNNKFINIINIVNINNIINYIIIILLSNI